MAVRSITGSETCYDFDTDISHNEEDVAMYMLIFGMDIADIETVTIDEIITASRTMFPHTERTSDPRPVLYAATVEADRAAVEDAVGRNWTSAAEDLITMTRFGIQSYVRRAFHWRSIAKKGKAL